MRLSAVWVCVVVACLLGVPSGLARAADVDFPSPDTAVTGYGTTTYLDLARHFVTDIKPSDNGYVGTKLIPLRHIGGKDYESSGNDSFGFYDISTVQMKVDGQDRLLVLFDFAQAARTAQGVAVLALYDVSHDARLIDAVDVGFDQSTYFFDQGLMPVASGMDVILTMSSHFNSSQNYATHSMIMVRNDRLILIDTAFLFGDKTCAAEMQQTIRYTANPNAGKPYAPITVVVSEATSPTGQDCGEEAPPAAQNREFRVIYTWDAAAGRYGRDSDVLETLAKANEERF